MSIKPRKIGILLSTSASSPAFHHGLAAAERALDTGARVFLYCIDDAVEGVKDARLQSMRLRGLVLYACALAAQNRGVPVNDLAVFGGLGLLGDMLAGVDEFIDSNSVEVG